MRNVWKSIQTSKEKKEDSKCTKMDARRLKRNTGLAVHANRLQAESLEIYKKNILSIMEHHFNNHADCGNWCPFLQCEGDKKTM